LCRQRIAELLLLLLLPPHGDWALALPVHELELAAVDEGKKRTFVALVELQNLLVVFPEEPLRV
jgi:hypothetical protein